MGVGEVKEAVSVRQDKRWRVETCGELLPKLMEGFLH